MHSIEYKYTHIYLYIFTLTISIYIPPYYNSLPVMSKHIAIHIELLKEKDSTTQGLKGGTGRESA